jgi:8-oxo-dGTP diphosphatase
VTENRDLVVAAGVVPWRVVKDKFQVLVVYRTQHRDVSLPKGKIDPGETTPQTAVRELFEETGLKATLGQSLGSVEYIQKANGKPKIVYYWTAAISPLAESKSNFVSNDEIFAIEWLSAKKAIAALTYEHDRDLVKSTKKLWKKGLLNTFALVVARHGKATAHDNWDGEDSLRPLVAKGMQQAKDIAGGLAAFAPKSIYSSPAIRCMQTIAPLSYRTGIEIKETGKISQDKWTSGGERVKEFIENRFKKAESAVICSHGPVIPQIVSEIIDFLDEAVDSRIREATNLNTGDFSVFHVSKTSDGNRLVGVEYHSAP